jgi:CzcA family heavy metal efflux pump
MWIVRLALRRPYTVAVLCFALLLFGALGIRGMRTDIFPVIDIPVVIVVWSYPGMSAEDMERRVVILSERAYSTTVDGISRIESQSQTGIGVLKIYFEPGADIGGAIAQITAVSQTASHSMPPGILLPSIVRYNASNVPVAQVLVSSPTLTEEQLYDYALNFIRIRLFTIPGLATPGPYGGKQRQIMIDLDPARAAAHGLSTQDVVSALLAQNLILPGGSARMGTTDYDVLLNSSPDAVPDFAQIPLRVSGGAVVTLGDVAQVHDGFAVQQNISRINGRRATYLAILKKASASTIAVVDATRDTLPMIKATAPEGMELSLDFDQSVFVKNAIGGVLKEAVIAAALVSVMIFFFLGSVRSVIIVSTSIPLAIMTSIGGLFLTGQTMNIMTLGGLSLAIGMLVDDATVEVENIHRNRGMHKPLTVAILDGAHQIATPALAATLTICIVFLPVFLLTGPTKFLFWPLALSVVFAMLASYFLSRTLVPVLARLLLQNEKHGEGVMHHFNEWRDRNFDRVRDLYVRGLGSALHHRAFVVGVGVVMVAIVLFLPRTIGLDFFPEVDAGQMRLHVRAPIGTRIEETEHIVSDVERIIREVVGKDVGTINDNIGVPISYNLAFVQSDNVGGQDADVLVTLKEKHQPTAKYRKEIRRRLGEEMPNVASYFQPADIIAQVLNFGIAAPIDVEIEGKDLDQNMQYARSLRNAIRRIPGAVDVRIPQVLSHPALFVDVDRDRAARVGVQQRDVANDMLVSLSSSSVVSPSFWLNPKNGVNYFVVVQTPITKVTSVEDLRSTPISSPGAQSTLPPYLGAVATVKPASSKSLITHDAVQRVVDVQVNVEDRDLGAVAGDVNGAIKDLGQLPPGMRVNVRGQSESMTSSFKSLGLGLVLATLLVYLLLVVLYQSWLDPFIILFAVPGAIVGVLWMLAVTHTTINVESLMGTIMSVGVAVSNSILLVNFANDIRTEHPEMSPLDAALEAGKVRLRPVLMTALAMILGMIPMATGLGEGGEQNAPLGRAVIGGLLLATFTTLVFVPIVYSLLRKQPPTKHMLDERFAKESHGTEVPA